MGTSSCRELGVVVLGEAEGGVRVKGGHSTGKVIAGAPLRGHRFPLQRLHGDVHTPLAPLLFFHPLLTSRSLAAPFGPAVPRLSGVKTAEG